MTNRAQRRAAARADRRLPPLCAPTTHRLERLSATVAGEEVAARVVCRVCRRTMEQILASSPADRAAFDAWVAAGEPETMGGGPG